MLGKFVHDDLRSFTGGTQAITVPERVRYSNKKLDVSAD